MHHHMCGDPPARQLQLQLLGSPCLSWAGVRVRGSATLQGPWRECEPLLGLTSALKQPPASLVHRQGSWRYPMASGSLLLGLLAPGTQKAPRAWEPHLSCCCVCCPKNGWSASKPVLLFGGHFQAVLEGDGHCGSRGFQPAPSRGSVWLR